MRHRLGTNNYFTLTSLLSKLLFFAIFFISSFAYANNDNCNAFDVKNIIAQIKAKNCQILSNADFCIKQDPQIIFKATLIEPSCLNYADKSLKTNQDFILRLLKINPEIISQVSEELKANPIFIKNAFYFNDHILKYADLSLLDNILFMQEMIKIDPSNYFYASNRIKTMNNVATIAFKANGLVLAFAPIEIKKDPKLALIALKSNPKAIEFADEEVKKKLNKKYLQGLISNSKKTGEFEIEQLKEFMIANYFTDKMENGSYQIGNKAKFFLKSRLINRNHLSKWQEISFSNKYKLVAVDNTDSQKSWKKDFSKYPNLAKEVESFLINYHVSQATIDNLLINYLWQIKSHPHTLAFSLYLLKTNMDDDLGKDFNNLTSFIVIAEQRLGKWILSPVQMILENDIKPDMSYKYGYKKYELWDLYKNNSHDKNPKIIFKVFDRFDEYLEVFKEVGNGKYESFYRLDN
jgi:hypothetical protein